MLLVGVAFAAGALAEEEMALGPQPASATSALGAPRTSAPWAREYAAGHFAAAVELLETIPEASRTGWHWLHLARAREKRGQLVESFATYERLHEVAADGKALRGMRDVERLARSEGTALSSRIPWANVALEAVPVGALVYVDQQWLDPARLRLPYPVNPGWHTFLVESNGEVLAARRVYFEEGQSRVVPLSGWHAPSAATAAPVASAPEVQRVDSSARAPAAPGKAPASETSVSPRKLDWQPTATPVEDAAGSELLTTAYVGLGVGALGAVVGTGFLLAATDSRGHVPEFCTTYECVDAHDEAVSRSQVQTRAATISYAVGLVGLLTGGTAFVLHRATARPATIKVANVELTPSLAPGGAAVSGRF